MKGKYFVCFFVIASFFFVACQGNESNNFSGKSDNWYVNFQAIHHDETSELTEYIFDVLPK